MISITTIDLANFKSTRTSTMDDMSSQLIVYFLADELRRQLTSQKSDYLIDEEFQGEVSFEVLMDE